jgi:hypothetical protein
MSARITARPAFPVCGLATPLGGRTALDWICSFRDHRDSPFLTYGLWLGHLTDDGKAGVRIGTFGRDAVDRIAKREGRTPNGVAYAATAGLHALVDLTIPDEHGRRTHDSTRALMHAVGVYSRSAASGYRTWAPESWTFDGVTVEARIHRFAGAWTGFTDALPDLYVVAVGIGVDPEELQLTRVTDATSYGFDLSGALDRLHHQHETRAWHETILPMPNAAGWHRDYLALLDPDGSAAA